jgi:molybdopterin-guanine dinucleotide biosynthesis protein A
MSEQRRILGLILSGGRSQRMGAPKAFVDLCGAPLITHVARRLQGQCVDLAISANDDPARYAHLGARVLRDLAPGFLGPLQGVLAGLAFARAAGFTHVASATVDAPFLPLDYCSRLSTHGVGAIACAKSGGRAHWAHALWPVEAHGRLVDFLAQSTPARLRDFICAGSHAFEEWSSDDGDPFFNINTAEDLTCARAAFEQKDAI